MTGNQNLITDAGLALAVGTGAGDSTGIIQHNINRSCVAELQFVKQPHKWL